MVTALILSTLGANLIYGSNKRPEFVFAKNGTSRCEIVIDKGASLGTLYGAKVLQEYLDQITNGAVPIIDLSQSQPDSGFNKIELKESNKLGSEGYAITCRKDHILIQGGALRGVLYGCIGLLQDHLGCRWYTATCQVIPKNPNLRLGTFSDNEKPAFEYREPFFTEAWNQNWAVMNRCNGNSMDLPDSVGGKVIYGAFVHTFSQLVPPDTYFKTHPEYYALVKGKRNPNQLELTNPEVAKIAIQTVESWIQKNPKAKIFSVSQNDNWDQSESPETQAINKKEGSPSGLVLQFVNKVAAAVAKKYPNILISTLAYQWTEKPPLFTRPLPNVRIRLAPIGADYAHALNKSPQNKKPYDNLVEWGNITHQLYIWSYCTNFAHYLQPLPDLDEISEDIPLFKKHGVVGVFYEGDYAKGGGGSFAELKSYLIAQLLWNPKQDSEKLIHEFVMNVYGKAAPEMMEWINDLQAPARNEGIPAYIYDSPKAPYFSEGLLQQGDRLFASALSKVKEGTEAYNEVQKAKLGLLYVELMRTEPSSPKYQDLGSKIATLIHKFGIQETSEGGSAEKFLESIGQR